jgi:hypothetical protein
LRRASAIVLNVMAGNERSAGGATVTPQSQDERVQDLAAVDVQASDEEMLATLHLMMSRFDALELRVELLEQRAVHRLDASTEAPRLAG